MQMTDWITYSVFLVCIVLVFYAAYESIVDWLIGRE